MRNLILPNYQSPGDVLMLTAAIRELHTAHPGKFQTDIRTSADAIWKHNPFITSLREEEAGVEVIDMHYPLVHRSKAPYHFIHGYVQYLEEKLGLRIPVAKFAGDIYLSDVTAEWSFARAILDHHCGREVGLHLQMVGSRQLSKGGRSFQGTDCVRAMRGGGALASPP